MRSTRAEQCVNQDEPRFAHRESAMNVRIEEVELADSHRREASNRDQADAQLGRQHRHGQRAELVRLKGRPRPPGRRPVTAGDPERHQDCDRIDQENGGGEPDRRSLPADQQEHDETDPDQHSHRVRIRSAWSVCRARGRSQSDIPTALRNAAANAPCHARLAARSPESVTGVAPSTMDRRRSGSIGLEKISASPIRCASTTRGWVLAWPVRKTIRPLYPWSRSHA